MIDINGKDEMVFGWRGCPLCNEAIIPIEHKAFMCPTILNKDHKNCSHYYLYEDKEIIFLSDTVYLEKKEDGLNYKCFKLSLESFSWKFICYLPKSIMNDPTKALDRVNNLLVFS